MCRWAYDPDGTRIEYYPIAQRRLEGDEAGPAREQSEGPEAVVAETESRLPDLNDPLIGYGPYHLGCGW